MAEEHVFYGGSEGLVSERKERAVLELLDAGMSPQTLGIEGSDYFDRRTRRRFSEQVLGSLVEFE